MAGPEVKEMSAEEIKPLLDAWKEFVRSELPTSFNRYDSQDQGQGNFNKIVEAIQAGNFTIFSDSLDPYDYISEQQSLSYDDYMKRFISGIDNEFEWDTPEERDRYCVPAGRPMALVLRSIPADL